MFIILVVIGSFILYSLFSAVLGESKRISLVIAPTSLVLYLLFYEDWIAANCSGECNIRIDLLLTYPALIAIVAVAFSSLTEVNINDYPDQSGLNDLDSVENNQTIDLPPTPIDFSDKYNASKVIRVVMMLIILMLSYMFWQGWV